MGALQLPLPLKKRGGIRGRRAAVREWVSFYARLEVRLLAGETLSTAAGRAPKPVYCDGHEAYATSDSDLRSLELWWACLQQQYHAGVGVAANVAAARAFAEACEEALLAEFLRELPTRANVGLILAFLPPVLLLLFYPLWAQVALSLP